MWERETTVRMRGMMPSVCGGESGVGLSGDEWCERGRERSGRMRGIMRSRVMRVVWMRLGCVCKDRCCLVVEVR